MKTAAISTLLVAGLATVNASQLIDSSEYDDNLPDFQDEIEADDLGRELQEFETDASETEITEMSSDSEKDDTSPSSCSEDDTSDDDGRMLRAQDGGRKGRRGGRRGKRGGFGGKRGGRGKGHRKFGKGMKMLKGMFGGKKSFDPKKIAQRQAKIAKVMKKMMARKCKNLNRFRGKFCKSNEADQENCNMWTSAMNNKCNAMGQCKIDVVSNTTKCMGAFIMTGASYFKEELATKIPAGMTVDTVGQCYSNTLISLQGCTSAVKADLEADLNGVDVPTKDELKAFRKAIKDKMKSKWGQKKAKRNKWRKERKSRRNSSKFRSNRFEDSDLE